jgi:hypothetical protein
MASEAVGINSAALGADHRDTAGSEVELARVLIGLGESNRAREILLRVQPIIIAAYGQTHSMSATVSELLAATSESQPR